MADTRPAHETKEIATLAHPFIDHVFNLNQVTDGKCNGTALWLGGQVLALYLAHILPRSKEPQRKRVVELGSGVGLTSLALCSLGYDVLATDIKDVVDVVLRQNISANEHLRSLEWGRLQVRVLDWSIEPEEWRWDDSQAITAGHFDTETTSTSDQLQPPFDMIITADTVYDPLLSSNLLRTAHALSVASSSGGHAFPPVYLCIERRDSDALDNTLKEAQDTWGFKVGRIPQKHVQKAVETADVKWEDDAWHGVEIWKLLLSKSWKSLTSPPQ